MKEFSIKILKDSNLKCTSSRLEVLEVLQKNRKPLSVQDLYGMIKTKEKDLVTVYRTVESFEKSGIVKSIDLRKGVVLYELAEKHHHHIVCTKCGIVEDVDTCGVDTLVTNIVSRAKKFDFVQDHSFELFSICNSCRIS